MVVKMTDAEFRVRMIGFLEKMLSDLKGPVDFNSTKRKWSEPALKTPAPNGPRRMTLERVDYKVVYDIIRKSKIRTGAGFGKALRAGGLKISCAVSYALAKKLLTEGKVVINRGVYVVADDLKTAK